MNTDTKELSIPELLLQSSENLCNLWLFEKPSRKLEGLSLTVSLDIEESVYRPKLRGHSICRPIQIQAVRPGHLKPEVVLEHGAKIWGRGHLEEAAVCSQGCCSEA